MRYRDTGSHLGRYPYTNLGTKAGGTCVHKRHHRRKHETSDKNQPFITQICTDREAVVMGCGASKVKKLDFYEVQSVSPVSNQALQFVEENNQEGCDFDEASHGVHASVVRELMESYKRDALAKMTTAQFSEKVIKPKTAKSKNSFTEDLYLDPGQRHKVGRAAVCVSHSWSDNVLSLFDAILDFVENKKEELGEDPIVWVDVLSVSQHVEGKVNPGWWLKESFEAIGRMSHVLVVVTSFNKTTWLTRLWMIFETLACIESKGKFSFTVPPLQKNQFLEEITHDPSLFLRVAKELDLTKCQCYFKADEEAISTEILRREYTFPDVENIVTGAMEQAWLDLVRKETESASGVAKGEAKKSLGMLLTKMGKQREGLNELEGAVELLKAADGEGGSATLAALSTLGVAYAREGRHEEMRQVCEKVLEARTHISGEKDSSTLLARSNLAQAFSELKEHDKALEEHKAVLAACKESLGESHEQTLASMLSMGASQYSVGDYVGAGKTLLECLERRKQVLGEQHAAVGLTMSWLGSVYMSQGRLAEAFEMKRGCLQVYRTVLGPGHADSVRAEENLAVARQRLQRAGA